MSIESEIREHAATEELADYLLLLIQKLKEIPDRRVRVGPARKKMLNAAIELERKGYRPEPRRDLIGNVPTIKGTRMLIEDDLYFEEKIRKRGDYKRFVASKVAGIMYVHGVKPTATLGGDYEILLEDVLKAVGYEGGDIHKYACSALKEINLYISSVTGS